MQQTKATPILATLRATIVALIAFAPLSGIPHGEQINADHVKASWYHEGKWLAGGGRFDPDNADVVAHKSLPFGTLLEFENPKNERIIRAHVRDRGPFIAGIKFDLSRGAARKLDFLDQGITTITVKILCAPRTVEKC